MVREYKIRNVLMKEGFSRQVTLNFTTFNRLIPYSSLIDEFQYRIFGQYIPPKKEHELKKMREAEEKRIRLQGKRATFKKKFTLAEESEEVLDSEDD